MKSRRGSAVALILLGLCLSASGQDKNSSVYPNSADSLFTKDVHERIARFEGPNEETAVKAIRALGSGAGRRRSRRSRRMKSTLATDALIRVLKSNRSDELRACAANHVAFFCPHDRKQQENVAKLLTALLADKTEADIVRDKIFTALADLHIDSADIVRGLILGTKSKDPSVVIGAVQSLGKRKWLRPEIIKALIVVCDRSDWPVICSQPPIGLWAIDALGEHRTMAKEALPTLKALLNEKNKHVVLRAATAITRIAQPGSASAKRTEAVLRGFIRITQKDVYRDGSVFEHSVTAVEGLSLLEGLDDRTLTLVGELLKITDEHCRLLDPIAATLDRAGARAKPYVSELQRRMAEIAYSYSDTKERRERIRKVIDSIEKAPAK